MILLFINLFYSIIFIYLFIYVLVLFIYIFFAFTSCVFFAAIPVSFPNLAVDFPSYTVLLHLSQNKATLATIERNTLLYISSKHTFITLHHHIFVCVHLCIRKYLCYCDLFITVAKTGCVRVIQSVYLFKFGVLQRKTLSTTLC